MAEDNVTFSNVEQVEAKDRPAEEKQTPAIDVEALKQSIVSEVKTGVVDTLKKINEDLARRAEPAPAHEVKQEAAAEAAPVDEDAPKA